jgi:hypothetical protein
VKKCWPPEAVKAARHKSGTLERAAKIFQYNFLAASVNLRLVQAVKNFR